jgi:4-amino-4-deoxy-L-arabinose transferase-like glycosyltransferase
LDTQTSILSGRSLRLVQIVCVLLILLKFAHLSLAGVFMDEAYYWMWGQHPALSYYDHPPLNAWLLSLSSAVFGWNVFALRLPVALAFLADIFAIYLIARRIGGGDWWGYFWLTLLLFLVMPIFTTVTNYALPDHILITALLYSISFFLSFFADRSTGGQGTTRDLLLGALFLGLAGLAKYNAAFLGLGVALFVVFYDRALLRQARLYLAAALAVVLQAPVIFWNATERFASFEFILSERHQGLAASFTGVSLLAVGIVIFVSPFLFWPIGKFAFTRSSAVPGIGLARAAFLVSTLTILAVAFVTRTLFHWNLVAYVVMLPFLALYMRPRWLLVGQSLWGIVFAVAIFVNYAIVPVTNLGSWRDEATGWSYDWSAVVQKIEAARIEHSAGFIATTDYTTASLLGFALRDSSVTSLSNRQEQYDYWFDRTAHEGEDAILYADYWRPLYNGTRRQFESVEEIGRVMVKAPNGRPLYRQIIYLAKGFKP